MTKRPQVNTVPVADKHVAKALPSPKTQAERIFLKFGGVPKLHKALRAAGFEYSISAIYRWNLPKNVRGTGGKIPSSAIDRVMAAARRQGVLITAEDLYPTVNPN